MKCPDIPEDDPQRLKALDEYELDSGTALNSLAPVVRIASRMFGMPIAAVNMIGRDNVFFAASHGLGQGSVDMSRDASFCAHAILAEDGMIVRDAELDDRFHDNPLVTGPSHIRFYAGVPLRSPEGYALGALCILDDTPHQNFTAEDHARLAELAKMASDRLELRRIEMVSKHHADSKEAFAISADSDPLTGLKNRRCFYRCVEDAVSQDLNAAIMMIDIDGFSDVNAAFGSAAGDKILCEIAERLLASIRDTEIVARIGGDEFAVFLPDYNGQEKVSTFAQQVIKSVLQPIFVQGSLLRVTVSCGISLAPKHGYEALELIANADLALSMAKRSGRNQLYIFTPELRQEATARRLHAMELLRAADNSEFVLFYQPQMKLSDGSLSGAEALLRWLHPTRGLLPPSEFLATLAQGPMAASVGSWILDEACSQAAYWRRCGAPAFRMGINLFDIQLTTGDLAAEIEEVLKRHGLPADALEIELTENIALNNNHDELVAATLQKISDMGVSIAFDDFGTGYASLSMLKQFPVARIKIDRSFVQNILHSRRDSSVTYAILDIARNFGIEAIAEGIETAEQWHDLQQHGCQEGQGYWFGKPLDPQAFAEKFSLYPQRTKLKANQRC